jgi:hypothetical protein
LYVTGPETNDATATQHNTTQHLDFGWGKSTNWYCIVPHGKKALPGREQAEKLGLTPHDRFPPSCTLKSPVLLRPRKHEMHYWGLHEAKIDSTNS